MSARRLRVSSSRTIERRKQEIRAQDDTLREDEVTRRMRAEMTWWDWFLHDYARYWYVLGAITLDVFLGLGLVDAFHLVNALGILIVIAVLVMVIVAEIEGFFWLWPRDIPTED